MAEAVNLYLDRATRETFDDEARAVGLSFSAYLRVMARIFREPIRMDMLLSELRSRIQEIIKEEERKV